MMELMMEDCLLRGDSSDLVSVLQDEGLTSITLTRLDQLVTKSLCGSSFNSVLVVLKSLEILSENRDDLQTLISHGLTAKVVLWFEAVHDLLTSDLQKSSAPLLSLTEAFYDYFQLLGQTSLPVSQLSVVLLQLARFALEPEIHFPLRLEAIRTLNSILEALSREQRRLIQIDQSQISILSQMAVAVLIVGDYELQVSLSEALCRLTPRKDRQQRANQWFSSRDVSSAFCNIRDADFEVDCRRFLNFVNRHHGDQRRVWTFPCVGAFLDSTELFPPKDEKLDAFWIDFNLGSGCVSFFIDEPQGILWGSIHLLKEDVDHYSLQRNHDECTGGETLLSVRLNHPIMHHTSRGQTVELNFKSEHHHELEEAAGKVFMKVKGSSLLRDGPVQSPGPPSAIRPRSYSRKKPPSQLKVLPLSSPSGEEDSYVTKSSQSELLFDLMRHSTPTREPGPSESLRRDPGLFESLRRDPGAPVGAELETSQEEMDELGLTMSPLRKEVFSPDRKRVAPDSGYLSDPAEGPVVQKRREEPQPEGAGSKSPLAELSHEGADPPEEEEGLWGEGAESPVRREEPVMESRVESELDLTYGITAAFNTFKTQLEKQFTGRWQNVEAEILLSLKESQQHVVSLLKAVHQHRLVLLQQFEDSISDQLNRLHENSTSLNFINTQILRFFQSERQRLGSFCDEHLQRLKSLESGDQEAELPSSQ